VLVITDPGGQDRGELAARIAALPVPSPGSDVAGALEIPVVYDGPDLAVVAELTGLPVADVIRRHAGARYTVGWLGFSPGFGYLTGLDQRLSTVPRLETPRVTVPAGAVAIAAGLAAVYPSASPGGWRILGRTSMRLWDTARDPAALLSPGQAVRFRAVKSDERHGSSGQHSDTDGRHGNSRHRDGARPSAGTRFMEVIRPGPLATVQDLGRLGLGSLGVPPSGAADRASLIDGNRLVGNDDGAAGVELTFGRAAFRFAGRARVAVTGARATVTLSPGSDEPARQTGASVLEVPDGGLVTIGTVQAGLRSYLAVAGGVAVPAVLGSRSADLLSGTGGGPLHAGDLLPLGDPRPAGYLRAAVRTSTIAASTVMTARGTVAALRVAGGPRLNWFGPHALDRLCAGVYTVTPASNRTGLRLDGPRVRRAGDAELPSEGLVTGSLQVPPDGSPILLLADHPTTGGYPVIAVVISADLGLAAQLRPGDLIRFAVVS